MKEGDFIQDYMSKGVDPPVRIPRDCHSIHYRRASKKAVNILNDKLSYSTELFNTVIWLSAIRPKYQLVFDKSTLQVN